MPPIVLFMGKNGSGQTTLVRYFTEGKYIEDIGKVDPISKYEYVNPDNNKEQFQIIDVDTGSVSPESVLQEIKNAEVICFTYSISESLDDVSRNFKYVKEANSNNLKLYLVGNMVDITDRKVTQEQGQEKAAEMGAFFLETSCKGDINMDLITDIIKADIFTRKEHKEVKENQNGATDKGSSCCILI